MLIGTIPLDEMMNMFVLGGGRMPVADQVVFTSGVTLIFLVSSLITVPAIIAPAMRGKGDVQLQVPDSGRI